MKLMTHWERKGRREGRKEGREEGRQQGERAVLLRQMRRRFGAALPRPVEQRIYALSLGELDSLAEALLDFATVEDLEAWLAVNAKGHQNS